MFNPKKCNYNLYKLNLCYNLHTITDYIFTFDHHFLLSGPVYYCTVKYVVVHFLFRIRMEHLAAITQEEANSLRKREVAGKQFG